MPAVQRFEDLEIWKLARILYNKIYPLTFIKPICDDFRLRDQLRNFKNRVDALTTNY